MQKTVTPSSVAAPQYEESGTDPSAAESKHRRLWKLDDLASMACGRDPIQHPRGNDQFQMLTVTTVRDWDQKDDSYRRTFDAWRVPQLQSCQGKVGQADSTEEQARDREETSH